MSLRSSALRRTVLFGAPFLFYLASMLHPTRLVVGEDASVFVGVHLALPVLTCLLAWTLLLLVDGVENVWATLARVLVLPFAIAYTVFTSFAGIAVGAFVSEANELAPQAQPAADELIGSVSDSTLETTLWLVAISFWLAAVAAVIVALRARAPWPALVLVAIGAAAFARSHVQPWGAAGMAALLAGIVWLELRPESQTLGLDTPSGYDARDDRRSASVP